MKRILLFVAFFFATIFSSHAYDFSAVAPSGQTLYYNIVNGNAQVTSSNNPLGISGDLIIPNNVSYNNTTYSVTVIGNGAFSGCTNLTSVVIPNTVTTVGDNAFINCSSLLMVIIGEGVTNIGSNTFKNCTSLHNVYFNALNCTNGGVWGGDTFRDCDSISKVYVGQGVSHFPNYLFADCNQLPDIYFYSTTPPTMGYNIFPGNRNITAHVPCSALNNYITALSGQDGAIFTFQCWSLAFELTLNSNNSVWGSCSYVALSDSIVEIIATQNYGYHFDHWSYGSTANPDTIMLTDDATITAIFAKNQYSVTGTTNDSTKGLVSGSATVDYLDTVTLTATANYGYQFVRWSDYSTENPRRIAATANITKTAIFDFNQYDLTVQADTSIHGYCNGSGSYNYLSERTISANANYGYHFTQWNDGDTNNPRVITLTQDTTFTALFAKNQYTLTVSSNDTTLGSVVGSGTYEYLDTVSISATTIEHYHFVLWDDGNTLNPRNIIVTSDISRSAIFAIDTHSVTLQAANITHGTCSGSGQYQYGTAATVEALPYSGYQFSHWSDGSTYNPYTFAVVNNIQLTAHFYAVGTPYQDTLYIDTLTIHDTVYFHDTTFVPVHDTTVVYITDSILIHDTVFVHDTIFVGVEEVDAINAKIYTSNGQIVVDGAERNTVYLYDVNGRILATKQDEYSPLHFDVPTIGTYLVKIGNHPARKVVVIR